jgi:hypothetical protein
MEKMKTYYQVEANKPAMSTLYIHCRVQGQWHLLSHYYIGYSIDPVVTLMISLPDHTSAGQWH